MLSNLSSTSPTLDFSITTPHLALNLFYFAPVHSRELYLKLAISHFPLHRLLLRPRLPPSTFAPTFLSFFRPRTAMVTPPAPSAPTEDRVLTTADLEPQPTTLQSKLHGYDLWRDMGEPQYIVAPMVDQSELVRLSSLPERGLKSGERKRGELILRRG